MNNRSREKQKWNYTLKVLDHGKPIQRIQTHSIRRFYRRLRTINWRKPHHKAYLKVSYGKQKDASGSITVFYNDGLYENKHDFNNAFAAFIEPEQRPNEGRET